MRIAEQQAEIAMRKILSEPASKPEDMMVHLLVMIARSLARLEGILELK